MKEYKHRCVGRVHDSTRWGSFHPRQCKHDGVVERDAKWYCKTHDPEEIKAKKADNIKKWNAKWDNEAAIARRRNAEYKACEGISTKALEEGVIQEMIEICKALQGLLKEHADTVTLKVLNSAVSNSDRILAKLAEKESNETS